MDFNLENRWNKEIKETSDNQVRSEKLLPLEEGTESFDDCVLSKTKDSGEVNSKSLEAAEDDFEDCEAKLEDMEEKYPESTDDESDDFEDCGKELVGGYTAEAAYNTDREISREEAAQEYEDQLEEIIEKKENDPSNAECVETAAPEIENTEGFLDVEFSKTDENIDNKSETWENTKAVEQKSGNDAEEVEKIERGDRTDDNMKPIGEVTEVETSKVTEQTNTEERDIVEEDRAEKCLDERIGSAFNKADVTSTEMWGLAAENAEVLNNAKKERNDIEAEMSRKFDDVLTKERGTDEYKRSLQEYNDLKDQKEKLDEKVAGLSDQQERLNQKSLDLREIQISRGEAAVAASVATIASAKALDGRFDEEYYSSRPDRAELEHIREGNSATIKELSDEKAALKLAMDAKMDQIEDYVISNHLNPHDTASDPYYKQIVQEHFSLKSAYGNVRYLAGKLDENNIRISEILGDEYIPACEFTSRSAIEEVVRGRDTPGETNYFIDETRASEVLSKFDQTKWEKFTLREQKRAIEQLADYNAEILGIEEKPRIVYYCNADLRDFGGYSSQRNAIYINEYNMADAAEAADTISHEYRHKYQHERAEKLENERDLAFKEGFENYIRAEDDYYEYKNQLVEADAREYAESVTAKIRSFSETADVNAENTSEYEGATSTFTSLNPMKGAVWDEYRPADRTQKMNYTDATEAPEYPCKKTVDGEENYFDSQGVLYRIGEHLLPNTSYEINGYTYKTDGQERIVSAEGKLHLKEKRPRMRIKDSIEVIGKGDQKVGDNRGHLIGDQFDGSNGMENLIPQDATINKVDFRNFENEFAREIRPPSEKDVYVKIEPIYSGTSYRPAGILVTYSIDGKEDIRIFPNN